MKSDSVCCVTTSKVYEDGALLAMLHVDGSYMQSRLIGRQLREYLGRL
jgi:hypothetical protein